MVRAALSLAMAQPTPCKPNQGYAKASLELPHAIEQTVTTLNGSDKAEESVTDELNLAPEEMWLHPDDCGPAYKFKPSIRAGKTEAAP